VSGAARTAYDVKFGRHRASSEPRESDSQLVSLMVELGMNGAGGRCVLELGGVAAPPADLVAPVSVKLDAGGGAVTVFTGETYASETTAVSRMLRAADAISTLAGREAEQAYQDMSADFIIKDLLGKADATAGTVSPGPDLPFYPVHAGTSLLAHIQALARLMGADVYTDGSGKVHVAVPRATGAADHRLVFGETILALDLRRAPAAHDGVQLWGEGAASAKGKDKAHWLTADLSGVKGEAAITSSGQVRGNQASAMPRWVRSGAIRSGAAAGDAAQAMAAALAARRLRGHVEVFGAPEIMPGDLVDITHLPSDHAAAALLDGKPLRVRAVRHTLSRQGGLRTRIEV